MRPFTLAVTAGLFVSATAFAADDIMQNTYGNTVVGCLIGTNSDGSLALPNAANGVLLSSSSDNTIGRQSFGASGNAGVPTNVIAFNGANGVFVESGNRNGIFENSIYNNSLFGIDLGPSPLRFPVQSLHETC